MDGAYVSALAALAGSVIGGLTSFSTSWLVQQAQTANTRKAQNLSKRELVYGAFIDEVSKRFGEALEKEEGTISDLVTLYAQVSRMQLFAPQELVAEAHTLLRLLVATYAAPAKTFSQVSQEHDADPLREFSKLCRTDLETF